MQLLTRPALSGRSCRGSCHPTWKGIRRNAWTQHCSRLLARKEHWSQWWVADRHGTGGQPVRCGCPGVALQLPVIRGPQDIPECRVIEHELRLAFITEHALCGSRSPGQHRPATKLSASLLLPGYIPACRYSHVLSPDLFAARMTLFFFCLLLAASPYALFLGALSIVVPIRTLSELEFGARSQGYPSNTSNFLSFTSHLEILAAYPAVRLCEPACFPCSKTLHTHRAPYLVHFFLSGIPEACRLQPILLSSELCCLKHDLSNFKTTSSSAVSLL